ncbi:MAG TPA: hypothetical protein DCK93_07170 [Blastocatellia bacterium]|jgi:hypothetical protein|nr:hypothetical protein [Blastocatellia bacterium]
MGWYKIVFPDDVFAMDEPLELERSAREVFEVGGFPNGFEVYLETQHIPMEGGTDVKVVFYFSPVATIHCDKLFKSYRGSRCDEPVPSGQPITLVVP